MATRAAEWERALREADNGKEPLRDVFIRLFLEADARLAGVEGTASSVAALQVLMTQDANTLINAVVTPLLAQIGAAADMGVLFSATSVTETAIGTGVKTFTIPVGMRIAFAPAAQLAIVAADDPAKAMWARKLGYDKDTGLLTVDVYSTQGTGLVSSWSITAGIAASMAAHVAVAATGLVPLGNLQGALSAISTALANDPAFGTGVLAALAARYTKTEADALIAGRQAATAASQLLAGLTPAGDRLPYFTAGDGAALTPLSGFWRSVLGAADDGAARTLLKAASAHNPRITGNLRFGTRTPIDALFNTTVAGNRRVFTYDTRTDTDGGNWRSRFHKNIAYMAPVSPLRGERRDFPLQLSLVAPSPGRVLYFFDNETIGADGQPTFWASQQFSFASSSDVNDVCALNGFVCIASSNGLGLIDLIGDAARLYSSAGALNFVGMGRGSYFDFSTLGNEPAKAIVSSNVKGVAMRAIPGSPYLAEGLLTPTIVTATTAGVSVLLPNGSVVDITRAGGYVAVSFDSDTRIRLVTPEGDIEFGPVPTVDVANTAWREHFIPAGSFGATAVAADCAATPRGLLRRLPKEGDHANGLLSITGPTFHTGFMPPNVRRALIMDNVAGSLPAQNVLDDPCTSTTGWTLGAGWSHDAANGEFDHTPGNTAPNDRVLTGLTVGRRYRVRILVANRSAGSLAAALQTAGDEAGALSVAANGEFIVGFTAAATTDTLRFAPTSDFNGSIQDVRVDASIADRGPVGRDALIAGTVTATQSLTAAGEIAYLRAWSASNYLHDTYTADLDFAGDFCVAVQAVSGTASRVMVQRASAATSGARWEFRQETANAFVFEISDGTNSASVTIAGYPTEFHHLVAVRRGTVIELWNDGELKASANASAVGSLANPSAVIRYGCRVDGSLNMATSFLKGVIIAESAPTAAQIKAMADALLPTFRPNALCTLGGTVQAVADVAFDPITQQIAVACEGVSIFKDHVRSARYTAGETALGNNAVTDVALSGATLLATSPAGVHCYRSEQAATMVESVGIGGAVVGHTHPLATTSLPGFLSPADKAKLDGLNKTSVGLGNVDNTADLAKPVSTAQAAAIAAAVRIRPNVPQRNYLAGATWLSSTSAADNSWSGLCWAPELGLFVSVGASGTGNRVMTSPDGITWTARTSAADNNWRSVCWSAELGLLVAVADTGTGDRVMTSPDGVTWTIRTSAADNPWASVCWSPQRGLFVAVAGSGTNRAMTSPDGINWTARLTPGVAYRRVIWAAELGLFVASAGTGTGNRISTSPEGLTWTARTSAADNDWRGLAWSPQLGLLVATAVSGTGNRVMTSPDAITWTARTSAADNSWTFVEWAPQIGLFVAIASAGVGTGDRVMTSPDGITWTIRTSATDNAWQVVRWSPELGLFCAVANSGTGNRAMTSVSAFKYPYRS